MWKQGGSKEGGVGGMCGVLSCRASRTGLPFGSEGEPGPPLGRPPGGTPNDAPSFTVSSGGETIVVEHTDAPGPFGARASIPPAVDRPPVSQCPPTTDPPVSIFLSFGGKPANIIAAPFGGRLASVAAL